jgi:hypothetical protein
MDSVDQDLFTQSCDRLERIEDLLTKKLIDDSEHKHLREILLSAMISAIGKNEPTTAIKKLLHDSKTPSQQRTSRRMLFSTPNL